MTVDGNFSGGHAGLQAITAATAGLIEASALIRIIDDATRRVAMIEVDGQAAGTGVLVGRDLLLTAAHVVRGTRRASARGVMTAKFDFVAGAETAPFETGVRAPVLEIVASSPPSDEEEEGSAVTWDVPASRLDYAMLRLESAPPDSAVGTARPRGHYVLQEEHYDFGAPGIVLLVQHPLRMPQTISYTTGPLQINGARTRIRYRNVNTAAGSSGSPLIDTQGRLLGIHHYAARGVNQGVPASAIARAVRLAAPAHLVPTRRSPAGDAPTASPTLAPTRGAGRPSKSSPALPTMVLRGHTGPISAVSVAFMNGRQMVVSGGFDQTVRAWDLATGEAWAKFEGHQNLVYTTDCTYVGDDAVALSGGEGPRIRVWTLASRQESKSIAANALAINALCCIWVFGRAIVVVGTTEGGVEAWDLASRRRVTELRGHTAAVSAVASATVDGRPVAITGSRDETIRLWDLIAHKPIAQLHGHTAAVSAVASATIDGRPVAITGSRDETIRLWDLIAHKPIAQLHGHTAAVSAVASATIDGRPVAITGSRDETIRLWDLIAHKPIAQLHGHTAAVSAVASATVDGRPVAITGSRDETIRLWDLKAETGLNPRTVNPHGGGT